MESKSRPRKANRRRRIGSPLFTTLCTDGVRVQTVKLLISTSVVMGVDNCQIEIKNWDSENHEVELPEVMKFCEPNPQVQWDEIFLQPRSSMYGRGLNIFWSNIEGYQGSLLMLIYAATLQGFGIFICTNKILISSPNIMSCDLALLFIYLFIILQYFPSFLLLIYSFSF